MQWPKFLLKWLNKQPELIILNSWTYNSFTHIRKSFNIILGEIMRLTFYLCKQYFNHWYLVKLYNCIHNKINIRLWLKIMQFERLLKNYSFLSSRSQYFLLIHSLRVIYSFKDVNFLETFSHNSVIKMCEKNFKIVKINLNELSIEGF